jgi:putative solute:sodium symporter small subunit
MIRFSPLFAHFVTGRTLAAWGAAAAASHNIDVGSGRPAGSFREGNRLMATPQEEAHWKKTTNLMLTHLGIWIFFGYIIHMFVNPLNKIVIPILGFPLGFYMAAQGSLIVFVVMLFVFAKQQDKIDREFGYAEDDD